MVNDKAGKNIYSSQKSIFWLGRELQALRAGEKSLGPCLKEMKSSTAFILSKLLTDLQKSRQIVISCLFKHAIKSNKKKS